VALVAGIFPLRREGQEEVDAGGEPTALEDAPDELVGRPRVGGRFQDDELPAAQVEVIASAVCRTYVRSGSFCAVSGVGTQMRIASGSPSRLKSAVASKRAVARACFTRSASTWRM
jgi:hypothetical protein